MGNTMGLVSFIAVETTLVLTEVVVAALIAEEAIAITVAAAAFATSLEMGVLEK